MPKKINFETLKWIGGIDGHLKIIDQTKLPERLIYIRCTNIEQLYDAIKTLAVRGAPAIGVAGAFGAALSLKNISAPSVFSAVKNLKKDCKYLASSRPTAVNLQWAIDRVLTYAQKFVIQNPKASLMHLRRAVLKEAKAIYNEDVQMCRKIGINGAIFIKNGMGILTHCNAGALATAGQGTALSVLYEAKKRGKKFTVYADETRPLLQGARLTAWELNHAKIDTTIICDNMAASLMKAGKIDIIITGADRIASNGDAANKTGTYGLSVLAKAHKIPFYIAAPSSTFDLDIKSGKDIPIEQRSADEIRFLYHGLPARGSTARMAVLQLTPKGVKIYNPAFDVTPAENITAIITERGIIKSPNSHKIANHFQKEGI